MAGISLLGHQVTVDSECLIAELATVAADGFSQLLSIHIQETE
jgi:hypothetical protein